MANEVYPFTIRSILRAGKSRSQPAAFSMADPRRGPGYTQATGTDVPVMWDVDFIFTEAEAVAFQLWGVVKLGNWQKPFDMPIRTEFGASLVHTCQFLPDSLLPATEAGALWKYSAKIMARKQLIPQEFTDSVDLIIGLPDWYSWSNLLDQAVNQEMPLD